MVNVEHKLYIHKIYNTMWQANRNVIFQGSYDYNRTSSKVACLS